MRVRLVIVAVLLAMAACEIYVLVPFAARRSAPLPVELAHVAIPQTTSDTWRRMQQTLQSPVDVFNAAWVQAMRGKPFNGAVGVAALAAGDSVDSFCVQQQPSFTLDGTKVMYCRASHVGPNPVPQVGFIIIPYQSYMTALSDLDMNNDVGQAIAREGTALVLARAYAQHLLAEFDDAGILSGEASQLRRRTDCLAGLTLRAWLPTLDTLTWGRAVAFANRFEVSGQSGGSDDSVIVGYRSGNLRACVD